MKPLTYLSILFVLLRCASVLGSEKFRIPDDDDHPIELSTHRLTLAGESLRTLGPTSVTWRSIRVDGQDLTFDPSSKLFQLDGPLTLQTQGLLIDASKITIETSPLAIKLENPRLLSTWGAPLLVQARQGLCDPKGCRLQDTKISPLGKRPSRCHWSVGSARVTDDGRVIIRRGTLRVGKLPFFYVPWIQLNPPKQVGLLPPRLAFRPDQGLIIGPALYLPLGTRAALWGFIAWRTAGGLETNLSLAGNHSRASLNYVHGDDDDYFQLELAGSVPVSDGQVAVDLSLLNSQAGLDEFYILPDNRISSHTISRGLITHPAGPFVIESSATILQPLSSPDTDVFDDLYSSATVGVYLPATHLITNLFIEGAAQLERIQLWSGVERTDALDNPLPAHTHLYLSPGVTFANRIGPLAQQVSLSSTHQTWLEDNTTTNQWYLNTGTVKVHSALPLARRSRRTPLTHVIEPSITYRGNLFNEGRTPPWTLSRQDQLRRGHGLEFAFETKWEHRLRRQLAKLQIGGRLDLPGFQQNLEQEIPWAYLFFKAVFGPRVFNVVTEGSFDERRLSISHARLSLRSNTSHFESRLGTEYIGPGLGAHVDQPNWSSSNIAYEDPWPFESDRQSGVFGKFTLRLPLNLDLFGSLRVQTWPNLEWHAVRYGLFYRGPCPLLSLGVQAIHYGHFAAPDILATLVVR